MKDLIRLYEEITEEEEEEIWGEVDMVGVFETEALGWRSEGEKS